MTTAATATLLRDGGWGPRIRVTVAPTPEADAAAAAFLRDAGTRHALDLDETDLTPFPGLADVFFPICEHGLSAHLCEGPQHYPTAEQEREWGA